ncbi:hypothetical protein OUZ56_011307 [Daphnia magna]|uniref:Secreted protein n=1 Tax=Daphnia magna TaxID=35525 RepID=A0ABQ9YZR8_9CRUS|nr:hypothetical protein OUZ56_011307 [Daphnia magna]
MLAPPGLHAVSLLDQLLAYPLQRIAPAVAVVVVVPLLLAGSSGSRDVCVLSLHTRSIRPVRPASDPSGLSDHVFTFCSRQMDVVEETGGLIREPIITICELITFTPLLKMDIFNKY